MKTMVIICARIINDGVGLTVSYDKMFVTKTISNLFEPDNGQKKYLNRFCETFLKRTLDNSFMNRFTWPSDFFDPVQVFF